MALTLVSSPPESLRYVELHARSAFSLLDGASTPEAMVARAAALGLKGLALVDRDDLGGAVRLQVAADGAGLQAIHGATLTLEDGSGLPLLVMDRVGWANLCGLISEARMGCARGVPRTPMARLDGRTDGLLVLAGGPDGPLRWALDRGQDPRPVLGALRQRFGDRLVMLGLRHHVAQERRESAQLIALAESLDIMWVPANDVRYATAGDRRAYDVMSCLRRRITLDEAGTRLLPNDAWHLKDAAAMDALWADHPGAVGRTLDVALRCRFDLKHLGPTLPRFAPADGRSDFQALCQHVKAGAHARYGDPLPEAHRRQLRHELRLIRKLGLSGYFLIVHDVVAFAQGRGILVQGRGSAANSAVCYCLGITSVDPIGMDLLFERFLSEGRTDPPDIDLDIAHMRREEVLQYVYSRWGRRHAAMVATTITWRGRSAVRDVARVMGFAGDLVDRMANQVGHMEAAEAADHLADGGAAACGLDPESPRVQTLVDVVRRLDRTPRHRSIHTGGFVLTAEPLDTVVPLEPASMDGRTVIQWDKDDLGPVGLVKIDLLGLGILTVLARAFDHIGQGRGPHLALHTLPAEDPDVFAMISRADTVGLFQIESRAQMNTLPRLQPRCFYDLVVQVAIIRPGPIQGEMVHPYIRRRRGEEPVTYLHPDLEPVLRRTLGVPLFQEQGMKVAIALADFTPEQADRLRKVMGFKRATDHLEGILKDLWRGMRARGIAEATALRIIGQLEAFANYGFPESHAASFARLAWASAWLKHHFGPEYLAAMLDAQPMGFYAPGTLIADARRHGVQVRPVDLLRSRWTSALEHDVTPPAVRLGLRMVKGLSTAARDRLAEAATSGPLTTLDDVVFRAKLDDGALTALAEAGAFRSLWGGRREALWALLRRLRDRGTPLDLRRPPDAEAPHLPSMDLVEEVMADYRTVGASHQAHPMTFLREQLDRQGVVASRDLTALPPWRVGLPVRVAGLVICRQRPASAKGMLFLTLEDEHGMSNVVIKPDVFAAHRQLLYTARALVIEGPLQRHQAISTVLGRRFEPLGGDALPHPHVSFR